MNPHELFTLREAAAILDQPYNRVRRWADAGTLEVISAGRQTLRLVPASELMRFQTERGFPLDWTAVYDLDIVQPVRERQQARPSSYPESMKPADVAKSEAYERVQRIKQQLLENKEARKEARAIGRKARNAARRRSHELHLKRVEGGDPTAVTVHVAADATASEVAAAQQISEARQAVIMAKAALRIGEGGDSDVERAEKHLADLLADERQLQAQAAQEGTILEAERSLLEKRLAEARAELEAEVAEAMRPAATKWLDALAAFAEANDALHGVESELADLGVAPVVSAARDVSFRFANSKDYLLPMFRRGRAWTSYYAAEVAEHRALARTRVLKREHEAEAEAAARLAERQAKAKGARSSPTAAHTRRRRFMGLGSVSHP